MNDFDHHHSCQHNMYRLSCAEFDALFEHAGGCCQICKAPGSETVRGHLVIDHDPTYGLFAVRGLLCDRCNKKMSYADAGQYVEEASRYRLDSWFLRVIQDRPERRALERYVKAGTR